MRHEPVERRLALGRALLLEDDAQRAALRRPGFVEIHRRRVVVAVGDCIVQGVHGAAVRRVKTRVFLDILRADVGDIKEAARFGQIRRGFERRNRRARVNRIDEHEIRARLDGRVRRQAFQIAVVANAPRLVRTHRIELRHPTPARVPFEGVGQRDARRCNHQRGIGRALAGFDMQRMVADRQIGRQGQTEIDGFRGRVGALGERRDGKPPFGAVLQGERDVGACVGRAV